MRLTINSAEELTNKSNILNKRIKDIDRTLIIGNFDGVHLWHKHLIKEVLSISKANKTSLACITFFPHSKNILSQDTDTWLGLRWPNLSRLKNRKLEIQFASYILHNIFSKKHLFWS